MGWGAAPTGAKVFICGEDAPVRFAAEEGYGTQGGEQGGDVVVYGVVPELFCDGPSYGGGQSVVECEQVACFCYCRCNWFLGDLTVRLVPAGGTIRHVSLLAKPS
jgi:hypothetical protein